MSWSFVMHQNGAVRENILKLGFNPGVENPHDLERLLDYFLPFRITNTHPSDDFDDPTFRDRQDAWFKENLSGCWQIWGMTGDARKPVYYFENEADAVLFKLRWS